MSTEENKRISWRLQEEVFGQGKLELVDELLAPDYISHAPGDPELSRGPEDIKEVVRSYHSAFPDINFVVEQQVAEGDMVVTQWIARHPSGGVHGRPSFRQTDRGEWDEHGPHLGGQDRGELEQLGDPRDDAPDRCHH
jgi:predicted SnoaL-like aldol condensation-catalyzing enzyme